MDKKSVLERALKLRPAERLELIERLTQSLDKPDEEIEQIWSEEAEKRYQALKEDKVDTTSLDKIIKRYK